MEFKKQNEQSWGEGERKRQMKKWTLHYREHTDGDGVGVGGWGASPGDGD